MNGTNPKNILITGSAGHIGSFLSRAFLKEGHHVTGMDLRSEPSLKACVPGPGSFHEIVCDLSQPEAVKKAMDQAHEPRGAFDCVINNAGLIHNAPLLRFENGKLEIHDFRLWNEVLSSTLSASFYVTAYSAQKMAQTSRRGVIINISSICARGNAGQSAYSAAKAGVNAMTLALAKELGPLGIRIAAIAPGFLDTPSTHAHLEKGALESLRRSVPVGALGKLEDVLGAVRFVMENSYFHGKTLELDGGLTL